MTRWGGSRDGRGDGARRRGGGWTGPPVAQELVPGEARIPRATLGVEDPELRAAALRPEAVAPHDDLGALAHDVAPEPQPAAPRELEPERARLRHRAGQPFPHPERLEDDEERAGAPGERRETAEPVTGRDAADGRVARLRQVDEEDVHGAGGEERRGERQRLLEIDRGEDDEPLRADTARDGLDGVERAREVEPGHDRAGGLRLRCETEGERRLARGVVAAEGDRRVARHAAGAEDRVQRGEARG